MQPGPADRPARRPRRPRLDLLVLVIAVLSLVPAIGSSSPIAFGVAGPSDSTTSDGSSDQVAAETASPEDSATTSPIESPTTTVPGGPDTVTVSSIPALLATLKDNAVDEIVVADGTYHVSPSNAVRSDSLWIGSEYAARTRPVTVRAQTIGGVTFDGGGGTDYGGLSFEDGVHDQVWDGFVFANMAAQESGIVEVGGYVPRRTPHHITLRHITIQRTCTGSATSETAPTVDHAFYISDAAGVGPHDLLFEDITVDGRGGLASAFHFFHGDSANPNATRVTIRRLQVIGTQQAIILWADKLRNIRIDTVTISDVLRYAVRFESVGSTGILLTNITSTGSGSQGFFSTQGDHPPGLTLRNDSLN